MSTRAAGRFATTMIPQAPYDSHEGVTLSRMTIEKKFEGDLVGESRVEMLSAMIGAKGSAGYVAIERVTGTLHGHAGTFVLQHSATMNRGQPSLTITVVPDSGTGALSGISGQLNIEMVEGQHHYAFEYALENTINTPA